MPNCFIFAIGGTGSRVLRSLAHLLAAGVKPDKNFDIVPIIIDPHHTNSDLQRTEELLRLYKQVKDNSKPEGFFPTTIKYLQDVAKQSEIPAAFTFKIEGSDSKFNEYIGYGNMDTENQALADLLFSGYSKDKRKKECTLLDIEMDIGFMGNPNVGSVVLNQVEESDVYKAFASALNPEDRIFIISSIFGGTGAAGFPCLLKNIRKGVGGVNVEVLKNAKIGAVTVLPYFKLEPDENSPISYSDFVAKTKSALYYYNNCVTGNASINTLYYIGDKPAESYKNDPGYNGQKNNAHFIELASALALIDFLNMPDEQLQCNNGKAKEPVCKEFSIKNNVPNPTFTDFEVDCEPLLKWPLSQFAIFRKYMTEEYTAKAGGQAWGTEEPKLESRLLNEAFYKNFLLPFFNDFYEWLDELSKNKRGFSPFNIKDGTELNLFINNEHIKKNTLGFGGFKYSDYDDYLNKYAKNGGFDSKTGKEKKLMDMFYKATNDILKKEYKLQKRS
jgi:hypothetical protein